jgi:DNA-directed RNA polymerase beta' subunit
MGNTSKSFVGHPVLLNRALTLRSNIQAFQPTLVQGCTICLHPLEHL